MLEYQSMLRKVLFMKQKQPNNGKIDDILYNLAHNREKTLDWFYSYNQKRRIKKWMFNHTICSGISNNECFVSMHKPTTEYYYFNDSKRHKPPHMKVMNRKLPSKMKK
jgi:hypothetical protein